MQQSPLHIVILIFTFVCLFSACKDDDLQPLPLGNDIGFCDIMLDPFALNPENSELQSYNSFSQVAFINELGDNSIFQISQTFRTINEGVFLGADSITYCYSNETIETTLTNDQGIQFTIEAQTKANFVDLASEEVADVLKLFYTNTLSDNSDRRLVFRKVLDIRNYPAGLYATTELIPSKHFIGKEFTDIEITNFNSPIVTLYYNDEIGIVAYDDENNILWRFDSKS